jgi:hypothetical protein
VGDEYVCPKAVLTSKSLAAGELSAIATTHLNFMNEDGDEEFTQEMLGNILTNASLEALAETLQALAAALGVTQLQALPVGEFYERRKFARAEELVADLADSQPALASQIRRAWKEIDVMRAKQAEADRRAQE